MRRRQLNRLRAERAKTAPPPPKVAQLATEPVSLVLLRQVGDQFEAEHPGLGLVARASTDTGALRKLCYAMTNARRGDV